MSAVLDALEPVRPAGLVWPSWVTDAPHVGAQHPAAAHLGPLELGANCQRYAYAVLHLLGTTVPPHRSSELWTDPGLDHGTWDTRRDLDLVLFNDGEQSWGAHVGLVLGDRVLHLSREVGRPAAWPLSEFVARPGCAHLLGTVRPGRTARLPGSAPGPLRGRTSR